MRRLLSIGALAAMLALTGCGSAGSGVTSPGTAAIAEVAIDGTKALIVADLAYRSAGEAALIAVKAGVLHGAAATKARQLNASALRAIVLAHNAQSAAAQAAAISQAYDAIAGLKSLLPAQ